MKRLSAKLMPAALAAVVAWLAGAAGERAAFAQPTLSHVTPGAVVPRATTEFTLRGAKLDGPVRVWTSFPAHVDVAPGDPQEKDRKETVCKVAVGAGVPVGIGGIAVATADGFSDVVYLMIDDLPSVADNGNNHAADQSQQISLPAAIDGLCDGTLPDYYRIPAKAGERISCEVVATRLGWDFDPLVRVLNAAGHELLVADDDSATGADSRFVFMAPADGDYVLELRDNRYKPGGRYRLRLGDFPLVSAPLPLVATQGVQTTLRFGGPLTDGLAPRTVWPLGADRVGNSIGLDAKLPGARSTGWTTLGITDLPVFVEGTDNKQETATPINVPCVVCGALESGDARDLFTFQGKKGAAIRFRATTRSAGSAAIVSLRVLDTSGKQLAESPVTDSDEPALSFTPPADGTYRLAVQELAGRGGSDYMYAVECRAGPQFSLLLKNDKNNRLRYSLPSGGAFYLDVQCQRAAYDGPITLEVEGIRSGWQVVNNVIPAKANEVRLYVLPPWDFSAGEIDTLRIIGRAAAGSGEISATMATTTQLRAGRPQTPYPPAWHDGAIFVSGLGSKPSFFAVSAKSSEIAFPRQAGQAQLTLDFERIDAKFKDVPLTVLPLRLPTGMTAGVKRYGNGPKETYDIVFKGPKELPEGQHALRYFAYAEMAGQGRGMLSGEIRLNVVSGENPPAAQEGKAP